MTSGATGLQSASMRSAPRGAMAAPRSTGLDCFLERDARVSRRWREHWSACARGVAQHCSSPSERGCEMLRSLDPSLRQRSCDGSNDRFTYAKASKDYRAKPDESRAAQASTLCFFACIPAYFDQSATSVPPPYWLGRDPKRSRSAEPSALRTLPSCLPLWPPRAAPATLRGG